MDEVLATSIQCLDTALVGWLESPESPSHAALLSDEIRKLFACCTSRIVGSRRIYLTPYDGSNRARLKNDESIVLSVFTTHDGLKLLIANPTEINPIKYLELSLDKTPGDCLAIVEKRDEVLCERHDLGKSLFEYLVLKLPRNTRKRFRPMSRLH